MGKKPDAPLGNSGMDIPDYVFESLARCLLPKLQAFYESEEGKRALAEWEEEQNHRKDNNP